MECIGTIITLKKDKVVIMTDSCEVVCIKRQPGMYQGLELVFETSEIIDKKKTVIKYSSLIAGVAAIFMVLMLYLTSFNMDKTYAYVDIDINSSWEFEIDNQSRVLNIEPIDKNEKNLLDGLDLKSKPLETAIIEVIERLEEKGVIDLTNEKTVLVSTCLNSGDKSVEDANDSRVLNMFYKKIEDGFLSKNVKPYFIEIIPDERELSVKNNMSMGRYSLFRRGKEQGLDLDIESIKQKQIEEILIEVKLKEGSQDDDNGSAQNDRDINNQDKDDAKIDDKNSKVDKVDENVWKPDLTIKEYNDVEIIKAIELANMEAQKKIEQIKQQVDADIVFEIEEANKNISGVRQDIRINLEEKTKIISKIKSELQTRIDEIRKGEKEKVQAELRLLNKKISELLSQSIND